MNKIFILVCWMLTSCSHPQIENQPAAVDREVAQVAPLVREMDTLARVLITRLMTTGNREAVQQSFQMAMAAANKSGRYTPSQLNRLQRAATQQNADEFFRIFRMPEYGGEAAGKIVSGVFLTQFVTLTYYGKNNAVESAIQDLAKNYPELEFFVQVRAKKQGLLSWRAKIVAESVGRGLKAETLDDETKLAIAYVLETNKKDNEIDPKLEKHFVELGRNIRALMNEISIADPPLAQEMNTLLNLYLINHAQMLSKSSGRFALGGARVCEVDTEALQNIVLTSQLLNQKMSTSTTIDEFIEARAEALAYVIYGEVTSETVTSAKDRLHQLSKSPCMGIIFPIGE